MPAKAKTTTIYKVYQPHNRPPTLASTEAKITAKQARIDAAQAWSWRSVIGLGEAYRTPEAAIEAWSDDCQRAVELARQVLARAEALGAAEVLR